MTKATSYFPASLPVIINKTGLYKTRCGGLAVITIVSSRNPRMSFTCLGWYLNEDASIGVCECWNTTGRLYFTRESDNDIVEYVDEAD